MVRYTCSSGFIEISIGIKLLWTATISITFFTVINSMEKNRLAWKSFLNACDIDF
jgi:hypothetical protein